MMEAKKLNEVMNAFLGSVEPHPCTPMTGGLINRSWKVSHGEQDYVLQQFNQVVFPRPDEVMANIALVTEHLRGKGLTTLEFLPITANPQTHLYRDDARAPWRLCRYVPGTRPAGPIEGAITARSAGQAYGSFHQALADFPAEQLAESLPGFHDTPARWATLLQAYNQDLVGRADEVDSEMSALMARGDLGNGLSRLDLPLRVVHNDAKWSNVLLAENSGHPCCVVDLDTVMPGTLLHDFGDMMRTLSCGADEEETDLDLVQCDVAMVSALAEAWLGEVDPILVDAERMHLLPAGLVIIFEQAVRFLTDYLRGDLYYQTSRPGHNLDRCRNQIQLLDSMYDQLDDLARALP